MKKNPCRWNSKRVLRLPDLDHAKTTETFGDSLGN